MLGLGDELDATLDLVRVRGRVRGRGRGRVGVRVGVGVGVRVRVRVRVGVGVRVGVRASVRGWARVGGVGRGRVRVRPLTEPAGMSLEYFLRAGSCHTLREAARRPPCSTPRRGTSVNPMTSLREPASKSCPK